MSKKETETRSKKLKYFQETPSMRIEKHFANIRFVAAEKPKNGAYEEEAVNSVTSCSDLKSKSQQELGSCEQQGFYILNCTKLKNSLFKLRWLEF